MIRTITEIELEHYWADLVSAWLGWANAKCF